MDTNIENIACLGKIMSIRNKQHFRTYWRHSTILKTSKNVCYLICNSMMMMTMSDKTLRWWHIEMKHIEKRFFRQKMNGTKILSFLFHELQLTTVLLLICNSYMNWSTRFVYLFKTLSGIFHFRFRFVFIKVYIFVQQNAWTLSL